MPAIEALDLQMEIWSLQGDASINMLPIDEGQVFSKPLQCLSGDKSPKKTRSNKGWVVGFLRRYMDREIHIVFIYSELAQQHKCIQDL